MSGQYKGQYELGLSSKSMREAVFVHCGAHCVHLVSRSVDEGVIPICDAMATLQEIGNLFLQSIKCRTSFTLITQSDVRIGRAQQIRPLCAPTRWLVRVSAIKALLNQYEQVSESLEDVSSLVWTKCTRAGVRLRTQLSEVVSLLSSKMALKVFPILEVLNRSLQSRHQTVSGTLQAVIESIKGLLGLRENAVFDELLDDTCNLIMELNIKQISLPRQSKPPKRLNGDADADVATTVSDYFRHSFFSLIDTAVQQLQERLCGNPGLGEDRALEDFLISGVVEEQVLSAYHEINNADLKTQMQLFPVHAYF
jgi:hypothetical protein